MSAFRLISFILVFASLGCGKGFQPVSLGSSSSSSTVTNAGNCGPYCARSFVFGALGDSITRAFDITTFGEDDPSQSWSTGLSLPGSQVNSISQMFAQQNWTIQTQINNFAVTGQTVLGNNSAFMTDVANMAATNPDYVTLLIGANDICHGFVDDAVSQAAFQTKIQTALQTLMNAARPPKVIAVASVPHIFNLTQIPSLASNLSCQGVWNLVCPNHTIGQTAFDAQWTMVNQALANAASAAGPTVIYDDGAVADADFTAEDVSTVDCFHPSAIGQAKISATVWQKVSTAVQTRIIDQN